MKKVLIFGGFLFLSSLSLVSCRDTKEKETVIKEVEVEKETPKEEKKGLLERTGEKVDEKVNKEIDKEIDKIGDDNN
jgi:hypothetical protein